MIDSGVPPVSLVHRLPVMPATMPSVLLPALPLS